jgi:hypothetical protein
MRQAPLKVGRKSEARGSTFRAKPRGLERRGELQPVSRRKLEEADAAVERGEQPRRRRSSFRRKGGFTPASPAQRKKVKRQGCRITGEHGGHVHPAHVCDRGLGGCEHEDCVIGLRADYHRLYDMQKIDVLPHLTKEEQAHLVSHVGLISALEQSTGERWAPVESSLERDYPGVPTC